ncbi:prepilin-type N-terminal cleavage/methylation domain-containing protein [Iocasia frigidifontis]|uniref:Prepilin-type N-terminal cleavage/methylation domain-containing protein n=1 Tax=Iocasia fonsfrigidae TaxID=2682810 RepID=A0A8A7KGB0_9FIRM|nr:prepilin-type N-terminal cleavage/methylation domain-containing protein [Iocasia fonsfrigidae]QTL98549.1 prepilin-type N-terminal cleavage/methylation domain-containing protein [Iocasia fonsfrigidae]
MLGLKRDTGFTLIEVLLTIVIIAVVFISISGYFANSVIYTHQAGKRAQAVKIAADTMENIKLACINDWDTLNLSYYSEIDNLIDSDYSLKADDFKINSRITGNIDIDGDGNNDGRLITVVISWDGSKKEIELKSLVVKK